MSTATDESKVSLDSHLSGWPESMDAVLSVTVPLVTSEIAASASTSGFGAFPARHLDRLRPGNRSCRIAHKSRAAVVRSSNQYFTSAT